MDTTCSTTHLTNDSCMLSNVSTLSKHRSILLGNVNNITIQSHGSSTIPSLNRSYLLNNVYHVPTIIKKLYLFENLVVTMISL